MASRSGCRENAEPVVGRKLTGTRASALALPGHETVFVVNADPEMRALLESIAASGGYRVETYESAEAFLDAFEITRPGCVILEVHLPGRSGLELQRDLGRCGATIPVIFVSACTRASMAVAALKRGAIDYVEKPFLNGSFLSVVKKALAEDVRRRVRKRQEAALAARLRKLTPREREVLMSASRGKTSREIAAELKIKTRTVEIHRFRAMRKLDVRSVASLVRLFTSFSDRLPKLVEGPDGSQAMDEPALPTPSPQIEADCELPHFTDSETYASGPDVLVPMAFQAAWSGPRRR